MASSPSEDSSSASTTVSGHDHENQLTTSSCKHPLQKLVDCGGDFIRKIMCPVNGVLGIGMERLKIEEEDKEQANIEKTEAHLDATSTACKHEYHLQCILEWCQRSSQCPMCWQPTTLNDLSGQESLDDIFLQERLTVKVTRDEDFRRQVGWDLFFDLVDHDKVRSSRVQKSMPFNGFKEEVARELGVPVQFQRFWLWARRINSTYRPDRPLTVQDEAKTDMWPISFPSKQNDDILLFFKLYDPKKGELRYVGRLFVKHDGKPIDILAKLNAMAGYAADDEIDLYKEIFFRPKIKCEPVDKRLTFGYSELVDGDIICFQKSVSTQTDQLLLADVPSFFEYLT